MKKKMQLLSMGHALKMRKHKSKTYKVESGGAMLPHESYNHGRPHASKPKGMKKMKGMTL